MQQKYQLLAGAFVHYWNQGDHESAIELLENGLEPLEAAVVTAIVLTSVPAVIAATIAVKLGECLEASSSR